MMTRTTHIGFLLFPGFPMACLTSMIEPMRVANEISGQDAYEWSLIGQTSQPVTSSALIDFQPTMKVTETSRVDYLIILSAPDASFLTQSVPGRIRSLQRHGTVIGAVSGGVFPLVRSAAAGDSPVAVHWCYRSAFDAEFPNHNASDQVLEVSSNVISAAGAASAFDLSLNVVGDVLGYGLAAEVACWFQHPVMRLEGVTQVVPSLVGNSQGGQLPELVVSASKICEANLSEPPATLEIAEQLGVSTRQLERVFKKSTGTSPALYFRKLRLDAARQVVLYTDRPLQEIATSVGYGNLQTLVRYYVKRFGVTPQQDRDRVHLFKKDQGPKNLARDHPAKLCTIQFVFR